MADKLGRLAKTRSAVLRTALALMGLIAASSQVEAQARFDRATATFAGTKYIVQPGDMLRIRIWGWPEAASQTEGSFPVETSGIAYLPVIGGMQVAGKTADEVQEEFRKRFAVEQRNPVVTVYPLFAVSVMGEVRAPGVIDVAPGYTVFDAISTAGGFSPEASRSSVLVVRSSGTLTIGGGSSQEAAAVMAQTPLQSGDRVVVLRTKRASAQTVASILQGALSAASLIILISRN